MEIRTKKGLEELLKRYQEAGAAKEEIETIKGCIAEGYAMDEVDFENAEPKLRRLWKGLK